MFGIRSEQAKLAGDVLNKMNQGNYYDVCHQANDSMFQSILARLKGTVDYQSASLYLMNREKQQMISVAEQGDGINLINAINFPMGFGLSAWIAEKKRVIHLPDIHKGTRHGHNPIRSFVAVPIIYNDEVIGVLNLAHIKPNAFGPAEVKKLQYLAQAIAMRMNDFTIAFYTREEKA
ncbi:MAG: GAF domain-containing protein [Candidatus Zhuqueibacterota bacterium]